MKITMKNDGPIQAPSSVKGHLKPNQLEWIEFDPSLLVELAKSSADAPPELAARLASCTKAAWRCSAYVQFVPRIDAGGVDHSVILETDDEDYVVDVDDDGRPLGVELLGVATSIGHSGL